MEKINFLNKTITKLEVNGKLITSEKEILEAEANYYQELYSEKLNKYSEKYENSIKIFLENNSTKQISNCDKNFCDQIITENEIIKSLKVYTMEKHQVQMAFHQNLINISGLI